MCIVQCFGSYSGFHPGPFLWLPHFQVEIDCGIQCMWWTCFRKFPKYPDTFGGSDLGENDRLVMAFDSFKSFCKDRKVQNFVQICGCASFGGIPLLGFHTIPDNTYIYKYTRTFIYRCRFLDLSMIQQSWNLSSRCKNFVPSKQHPQPELQSKAKNVPSWKCVTNNNCPCSKFLLWFFWLESMSLPFQPWLTTTPFLEVSYSSHFCRQRIDNAERCGPQNASSLQKYWVVCVPCCRSNQVLQEAMVGRAQTVAVQIATTWIRRLPNNQMHADVEELAQHCNPQAGLKLEACKKD